MVERRASSVERRGIGVAMKGGLGRSCSRGCSGRGLSLCRTEAMSDDDVGKECGELKSVMGRESSIVFVVEYEGWDGKRIKDDGGMGRGWVVG